MPYKDEHSYPADKFERAGGPGTAYTEKPGTGADILREFGYSAPPLTATTIADLVLQRGGTGRLVEDMGYTKGTKEYRSAQRAVQRHLKGTTPKGDYATKYNKLFKPPAGEVRIAVRGKIKVSEEVRDREVNAYISGDPDDIAATLESPLENWYAESEFGPVILSLTSVTVTFIPR